MQSKLLKVINAFNPAQVFLFFLYQSGSRLAPNPVVATVRNKGRVCHLWKAAQGIGFAGLLLAQMVFHTAWAGPVTWYLDNIRFDSGATATGSFTYDPEPYMPLAGLYGTYSNININVNNANGTVNAYRSVNPASRGNEQYLSLVAATAGDLTGVPFLALTPAAAMTAAGGVIDILPGPQNLSYQGFCRQSNCGPADAPYEEVLAGGRIIGGPQVWTVENLQFDSGATASGYFFFDSDTGTFPTLLEPEDPSAELETAASVNGLVTVTRNSNTTRFRVVNPATGGNSFRITLIEESIADLTDRQILVLNFLSGMTNRGGTIDISTLSNNSYLGLCADAACGSLKAPFERALAGAQIVSAPSPSTWYLEGIRFDNGATASGSFKYGIFPYAPLAGLYGTYADINIQVSNPNGTINEYRIVNRASRGNQKYVSIVAATGGDLTGKPFLALTPAESMIGSNRSIPILPGPQNLSYQGVCRQANCGPADSPYQEILAGGRISQQTLTPPTIVSSAAVSVSENQTAVIDVEATDNLDSEGNGLVYSKTGGADQALFNLNTASGVVTFIAAPDFENAADVGGDNVYNLQVTVTDFGGLTAVQDIAVTVTDVVEDSTPPTANPAFEPAANAAGWHNDDVTITWNWLDEAGGSGINPDNCATTSTLLGEGSLATVGQCSDLAGNLGLQGSGTVNIDKTAPESANPLFDPAANAAGWYNNDVTITWNWIDPDTASGMTGSGIDTENCAPTSILAGEGPLAIVGQCSDIAGNPGLRGSGSIDIDKTPPETTINAGPFAVISNGEATFVFSGSDALSGIGGFECILDNGFGGAIQTCTSPQSYSGLASGSYTFSVRAFDVAGNVDGSPATYSFVQNIAPVITSPNTVSVAENQTTVIDVQATDDSDSEGNGLTFSLDGGSDAAFFSINETTGVIAFLNAPDFENPADVFADNIYEIAISVTDSRDFGSVQMIAVTVTDADETPPVASPTFDPVANGAGWHNSDVTVSFNWSDNPGPNGEPASGVDTGSCNTTALVTSEGVDVSYGSGCVDLAGNVGQTNGFLLIDKTPPETTILASPDAASNSNIATFSFEGVDSLSGVAGFECELQTPQLTFGFVPCTSPHVYSGLTNDSYLFQVRARDVAGLVDSSAAVFNLTVDSTNQPPVFTSPDRVVVDENQILAIDIQSSDDADSEGAGLVYDLASGDDQSAFTLDSATGVLSFLSAPDFEDSQDSDGNNTFEVLISLTDSQGLLAFQQLVVEVRDVYEPGDGELISIPENQIYVINTGDLPGAENATAFTISGGADQALFNLDATTGELVFISAPDYENPQDAGRNNQYSLEVTVSNDSGLFLVIRLAVEVLDEDETMCFFVPTSAGGVTICL